jgi:intracellular sulfur oxidation DsrE/DsrF family protein
MNKTVSSLQRRRFLRRAGAGLAGIGTIAAAGTSLGAQAPAAGTPFQPAMHEQDAWLDQIPGRHRLFIDSVSADGFGEALHFAANFYTANETDYGLDAGQIAVVVCARHRSTPFAYNDAMWAKYGEAFSRMSGFTDPQTKAAPVVNVFLTSGHSGLSSMGTTIGSIVDKNAHFAVCQMATRAAASQAARATSQSADAVYAEITSNLVGNARMVPAGILAVGRAQEHGYSFAYGG